ncbi:hypothetical protein [Neisseria sp. Ec49-e6-T10]|uniref:hypothetical protein n=1 Tax=Neisseria sp. Ec49-e6-T10 TaxID=3140744 RepID=UPI003EBB94DF
MRTKIFDQNGIKIYKENKHYYVRYDVGAHQIVIRKDEITEEEASKMMSSMEQATQVLFRIQKTLEKNGENPYISNIR